MIAVLMLALAVYALTHWALALLFWTAGHAEAPPDERPDDAITVLVPARNEGAGAVRALRSLIEQDHAGPLQAVLLLRDRTDTAMAHLEAAFGPHFGGSEHDVRAELGNGRVLRVCFTGHDPKHHKINGFLERLDTPLVAILDADHAAKPTWVRTSVAILSRDGGRLVQGRREPFSARGLFALWDSLHQHIGCEVSNVAWRRLGLTVFFTGTTAVMHSDLLRAYRLEDCLTEDTDLSYRLILAGEKLSYNPHSGSVEEVSPDLYSFLARRRRWANGHTEAFFDQLPRVFRAPIGLAGRLQFLFHGAHYLVALPVFLVHLGIGLYFATRLPSAALGAACFAGALLALAVVRSQPTRGWLASGTSLGVIFLWLTPAVVLLINTLLAGALADPARAMLPLSAPLQAVGLLGFFSPLLVLLIGLSGFRQLGVGSGIAVVLSYPIAFYLDVCGALIGLVDLVSLHRIWLVVAREPSAPEATNTGILDSWRPGAVLASTRNTLFSDRSLLMKPSRWIPALVLSAVVVAGVVLALPARSIPLDPRSCQALEHDGHPWIVPPAKLANYCGPADQMSGSGTRTGSFSPLLHDDFATISPAYWDELDDTFFCNLAKFSPDNLVPLDGGGFSMELREQAAGDRAYTSASIATKNVPEAKYLYGRFEVEMKPARASGVLTAFFLYRFDPWQEIDMEFVGRDTTKILLNVYYNPGEAGDLYNYGFRGTPVMIDLGFDAADDFHRYAIEWDPNELRWFVDDALVHVRRTGRPTPVPHLPMRFHINTWPICAEDLAGPMDPSALPTSADVRSVTISSWAPPLFDSVGDEPGGWRSEAGWIQP